MKDPIQIIPDDPKNNTKPLEEQIRDVYSSLVKRKEWAYDAKILEMCLISHSTDSEFLREIADTFVKKHVGENAEKKRTPKLCMKNKLQTLLMYHVPDDSVAIGLDIGLDVEWAVMSKNNTSKSSDPTCAANGGSRWIVTTALARIIKNQEDSLEFPPPIGTVDPFATLLHLYIDTFGTSGNFQPSSLYKGHTNLEEITNFIDALIMHRAKATASNQEEDPELLKLLKDAGGEVGSIALDAMNQNYDKEDKSLLHVLICGDVDELLSLLTIEGFAEKFKGQDVQKIILYRPAVEVVVAMDAFNEKVKTKFDLERDTAKWNKVYSIDYVTDKPEGFEIVKFTKNISQEIIEPLPSIAPGL
ncbi:unnamed protein product [Caenorhabditis sp. 36 PRJEB53466]|nr:unnamed protein product [Caenorhabditis sp. 36 PRJEB53466]